MSLQSDLLLVVAAAVDHHHQHQEVTLRKVQNCRESNDENARDMAIYMLCLPAIGKSYRWHKLIKVGAKACRIFNSFTAFFASRRMWISSKCELSRNRLFVAHNDINFVFNKIMNATTDGRWWNDGIILRNEANRSFYVFHDAIVNSLPSVIYVASRIFSHTYFWYWI